ncbi:MAG: hypothetical protein ACI8UO_002797 [Verrucomicrobiales bacterium]
MANDEQHQESERSPSRWIRRAVISTPVIGTIGAFLAAEKMTRSQVDWSIFILAFSIPACALAAETLEKRGRKFGIRDWTAFGCNAAALSVVIAGMCFLVLVLNALNA